MSPPIGTWISSVWHTLTSNDRHFTIDSPYHTGRHVPLSERDALASVATASDSRADVSHPYSDENGRRSGSPPNGNAGSPYTPTSPGGSRPYSPGLRSASAQRSSQDSPTDIQLQSFEDGLAPPPPVSHTWDKIDKWAEDNYPELFDNLCEGATINDLNELEHHLDCSLPQDVRESLMFHDGQERGGRPTGIVFGSMLLDCEEILQEWDNWRKVNQEILYDPSAARRTPPTTVPQKAFGGGSSHASSSRAAPPASPMSSEGGGGGTPSVPNWRQELLARQDSVPAGAIKKVYAHNSWIPLVRDWGGNNIAVDLAPGPGGRWGQVILVGRDYDTKYVVARSWAAFLAMVADDLESGKWFVDEETLELKLREFKQTRVEPAYFSILRWRVDQKYGRRGPNPNKRMSVMSVMSQRRKSGSPASSHSASPYASPTEPPATSPLPGGVPRMGLPKPSPLSRVAEESAAAAASAASAAAAASVAPPTPPEFGSAASDKKPNRLVGVDTLRASEDANALKLSSYAPPTPIEVVVVAAAADEESGEANDGETADPEKAAIEQAEEGMKTIAI